MMDILKDFWAQCLNVYAIYSDIIHSILPAELGDLCEYVLDVIIVCLIVKGVASIAFGTRVKG